MDCWPTLTEACSQAIASPSIGCSSHWVDTTSKAGPLVLNVVSSIWTNPSSPIHRCIVKAYLYLGYGSSIFRAQSCLFWFAGHQSQSVWWEPVREWSLSSRLTSFILVACLRQSERFLFCAEHIGRQCYLTAGITRSSYRERLIKTSKQKTEMRRDCLWDVVTALPQWNGFSPVTHVGSMKTGDGKQAASRWGADGKFQLFFRE